MIWLLGLDAVLLDFYHLAQHVHEAARLCLGENEAARAWVTDRLREIKTLGPGPVLEAIEMLANKVRAVAKQKSLRGLKNYIRKRREMLDYPGALAKGWDIGSGPTEATYKTLTLRLKRPGMKWDRNHAAGMMNLLAMPESGQWQTYWKNHAAALRPQILATPPESLDRYDFILYVSVVECISGGGAGIATHSSTSTFRCHVLNAILLDEKDQR